MTLLTGYLVTSGASQAVCWPFDDVDGPMGKAPLEVAAGGRQSSTVVAAHPLYPYVAVGFQDGLTLLTSLERDPLVIPLKRSERGAVTALAFSPTGSRLLIADAVGDIVWLTLPEV